MTTPKLACCPSLPHFLCGTLHSCELRNTNFSLLCFMFQLVFFHRVFCFPFRSVQQSQWIPESYQRFAFFFFSFSFSLILLMFSSLFFSSGHGIRFPFSDGWFA